MLTGFDPSRYRPATADEIHARRPAYQAVKLAVANGRPLNVSDAHPRTPNASGVDSEGPRIELIRGDTVRPEAIAWIWDGFLAAGKMHVLAGAPGTGKTTIALALAATVTTGGRWPDGSRCDVGDALIWSGEDSPADTLAPRLIASGADMSRVHFVGPAVTNLERRPFDPATDFPALICEAAKLPALRLMLVDPIVSAVAGDSHKNAETRRALAPLVEFAEQAKCALIGISHFTKGTKGSDPVERITGSLAFAAVARVVLVTAKLNEDDDDARVVVRAKSNIGPDGGGFRYELHQVELGAEFPGLSASRVEWGKPIEGEAREILATAEHVDEEGGGSNAKEFLRYLLAAGPMLAAHVFRDGEAHGYSKRQLQRARADIGATIDKLGMQGGWQWTLPKVPLSPEDTEDAGRNSLAPSAPSAAPSAFETF